MRIETRIAQFRHDRVTYLLATCFAFCRCTTGSNSPSSHVLALSRFYPMNATKDSLDLGIVYAGAHVETPCDPPWIRFAVVGVSGGHAVLQRPSFLLRQVLQGQQLARSCLRRCVPRCSGSGPGRARVSFFGVFWKRDLWR